MIRPSAANLWRALGALGALIPFAGCGGAAPTQVNVSANAWQNVSSAAIARSFVADFAPPKSWMATHAKGPLLYVSDSQLNVVFVYTWPSLRLIGNLSGFRTPQGECVDGSGDVWITNTQRAEILEFARGSTKLIKTLADPGEYPVSCAFSGNGDLAVTNILSRAGHKQYGTGSLSIYKGAAGHPKVREDSAIVKVYFDSYDSHGDLFFDGADASGAFALAEFDGKKITPLTVSGATINFPGAIQVTGSNINVEDQLGSDGNSIMYQTTQSGSTLTVGATAQLVNGQDCVESYIYGTGNAQRLICPDGGTPSINVYRYPAGGTPKKALYRNVLSPNGAAISP